MGSIFAGLVQVGAWGCFDEFNRINIEVLSVVSAQLKAIQNSLISGKPTVDIGVGGEIKIKRVAGFATCGVFITMNPGYAGRTELPDNLKALFRPVTMIVPDLLQICEIMLFSEGFEAAKVSLSPLLPKLPPSKASSLRFPPFILDLVVGPAYSVVPVQYQYSTILYSTVQTC